MTAAAECWRTDGRRVWRSPGGAIVCVMGDPSQGSLFDDATLVHIRDAAMVAMAPRLAAALEECARRLENCCHHAGTTAEFSHQAVADYRALLAEAHGRSGPR